MHSGFQRLALSTAIAAAISPVVHAVDSSSTGDNSTLQNEDVIVYGDKQAQSLQDLPMSVGVLTNKQLETSNIQDLNDVYSRLANVTAERGGNESLFTIRGVSVQGLSSNPDSFTASVLVDDVPLDNLSIRYGAMSLWDVEQIEVYRGPQATLQGRNSLNGAIYLKTKDPSYEWGGSFQTTIASNKTKRVSLAGGGALIDDLLAFRLSVDGYESDGFVNNITRNEKDYAGFERQNIRAKFLLEPSDDFYAKLTLSSLDNDMGDNPNTRLDDPFSFEAQSEKEAYHNIENDMVALDLGWDISDGLKLTSITSLSEEKYDRFDDYDSTSFDLGFIAQEGKSEGFTQEIRLNFSQGNWSGVAGLYYGETDRKTDWDLQTLYAKSNVGDTAIAYIQQALGVDEATATLFWGAVPTFIDITNDYDARYEVENIAIFGESTWHANDNWAFTFGARYDKEDQKRREDSIITVDTVTPDPQINGLLAGLESLLQEPSENVKADYDAFLPKAVAQYFWSEDVNAAFMVQKGYRAGGSTVNVARAESVEYDPEYTVNYELALRSVLLDGDLTLNANLFYTDWKDMQVDVQSSNDALDKFIDNAGESSLYGLELELLAYPINRIEVFANAGYVKTEFEKFAVTLSDGQVVDYKGHEFKGAANLTASTGFKYKSVDNFVIGLDANYQGESYQDNSNTRKVGSRTVFNGRLGYELADWSAYLWATNLTNKEYIVSSYNQLEGVAVQDYATPGTPRMIGGTVKVDF